MKMTQLKYKILKTKAFIFDLDGVIVDTAKYHYLAWQKIANQLGIEFTPEHNEELKGVSRVRSLDLILELGKIEASQENKNLWLVQKNEDYLSYLVDMDESEILSGVVPVLKFLKENNQKIDLAMRGLVIFEPLKCSFNKEKKKNLCSSYKIYGSDQTGKLIQVDNQTFFLSNF